MSKKQTRYIHVTLWWKYDFQQISSVTINKVSSGLELEVSGLEDQCLRLLRYDTHRRPMPYRPLRYDTRPIRPIKAISQNHKIFKSSYFDIGL